MEIIIDYEKKYKEALQRAKHALDCDKNGLVNTDKPLIMSLFPELKESEDERIRKSIHIYLDWLDGRKDYAPKGDYSIKDMITWIEKQGGSNPYSGVSFKYNKHTFGMCARDGGVEILIDGNLKAFISLDKSYIYPKPTFIPKSAFEAAKEEKIDNQNCVKPTDKVEPKFKVGDWVTNGNYTWKIVEVKPLDYILQSQDGNIVDDTISHVDGNFLLWAIKDAKDGDVLACDGKHGQEIGIGKKYVGKYGGCDMCFVTYCFVDWDGIFRVGEYVGTRNLHPATKEQRDLLFQKMKDAGYEFDFEKKKLKNIEQHGD